MANMTIKLFEKYAYGIAAMKKMGEVPENFRLYQCGWVGGGQPDQWHGMQCEGAEFRAAKSGPNKGVLSIMIPGTKRSAYGKLSQPHKFPLSSECDIPNHANPTT